MRKFNKDTGDINNPTVGSAFYFWKIGMATSSELADNPINNHNREWWDRERKRIESIPRKKQRELRVCT